jgi:hypothetical protein
MAVGAPVRHSVGGLQRHRLQQVFRRGRNEEHDVKVLTNGLEAAISPRKDRAVRLALATVDGAEAAELVLASLAAQLAERGVAVFLVDLSQAGHLERSVERVLDSRRPELSSAAVPLVFRPDGVPSLAKGPIGVTKGTTSDLPKGDPRRSAWDSADVILTLAEVDPAVGVDHLRSWTGRVVLLVTAGRSSAERLRTTSELIRSAGMQLLFAMIVGADGSDESSGRPEKLGDQSGDLW